VIDGGPGAVEPLRSRRPSRAPWIAGGGFALVLLGLAIWFLDPGLGSTSRPATARVGEPAPEIRLPLLESGQAGARGTLSSLAGKPVVVNFWATWCGPCGEEFPALEAKYREYKDTRQLVLIGVDAQGDGGPMAAQHFVDQKGTTYPIWLDLDGSAEAAYHVDALPTTLFIDRRGIIRDIVIGGPMTTDYIEAELKKIF
jgi:thiol-disulfide isomerase/thioredoxin